MAAAVHVPQVSVNPPTCLSFCEVLNNAQTRTFNHEEKIGLITGSNHQPLQSTQTICSHDYFDKTCTKGTHACNQKIVDLVLQ